MERNDYVNALPEVWTCPDCGYAEYKNRPDWPQRAEDHHAYCLWLRGYIAHDVTTTLRMDDRFWSSPWAYVLLAILTATIIGELVWLVR